MTQTFFNQHIDVPHNVLQTPHGSIYGTLPQQPWMTQKPGTVPQVPNFTGAGFFGSIKKHLGAFGNAFNPPLSH